jgi:hypothetical protein
MYADLTMQKLFILLVTFVLVIAAAPPAQPTNFNVTCTGGTGGQCSQPVIHAENVDPGETYVVDGTSANETGSWQTIPDDFSGTSFDLPAGAFLDGGEWTFELRQINSHNGHVKNKLLAIFSDSY